MFILCKYCANIIIPLSGSRDNHPVLDNMASGYIQSLTD